MSVPLACEIADFRQSRDICFKNDFNFRPILLFFQDYLFE